MAALLIDVNALIYWIHPGSPWYDEMDGLVYHAICRGDDLYVSASSLNETYYVLRKQYGVSEAAARGSLVDVADVFSVLATDAEAVNAALVSDEPDYEDAVVRAVAENNQVDGIITYDRRAFKGSFVPSCTATEWLDRCEIAWRPDMRG